MLNQEIAHDVSTIPSKHFHVVLGLSVLILKGIKHLGLHYLVVVALVLVVVAVVALVLAVVVAAAVLDLAAIVDPVTQLMF